MDRTVQGLHRCRAERSFFQNHVRIRPANAESADASHTRPILLHPGDYRCRHLQGRLLPGQVRVGLLIVKIGGDRTMPQGQHCLDQAGHPRGHFQMADVGFDRSEIQRSAMEAILAKQRRQGPQLDRIAQESRGSLSLDEPDRFWLDPCLSQGKTDDRLLGGAAGYHEAGAAAIVIDCRAPDYRQDRGPVRLSVP